MAKKKSTTKIKKITKSTKKTAKPVKKVLKKIVKKKPVKKAPKVKVVEKVEVKAQEKKPTSAKATEGKPTPPKPIEFDSPLVKKYQEHKGDTGSTGVQIAILTDRILELVSHLKKHPKDFDSKRGLLILVGKRRRLLNYLKKTKLKTYEAIVADLKLRK